MAFAVASLQATSSEVEIRIVLADQQAAWNDGNIEAFMTAYEESVDTSFISDKLIKSYETVFRRYREAYGEDGTMGKLAFSDLDFRILNVDHALVTGRFHLTRDAEADGDSRGIFTLVWARIDGKWKIIHDHTTALN